MSRNIEIKAQLTDPIQTHRLAAAIADEGPVEIPQDDTFFICAAGRLKLRRFSDDAGELIFYQRADESGPKESFYLRTPTPSPDVLCQSLSLAYGVSGRVTKHRTLYLVGRTRIHIDRVEKLGDYLELEVVLGEDEAADAAIVEAEELMGQLGIERSRLVQGAYVDLINRDAAGDSTSARPDGLPPRP